MSRTALVTGGTRGIGRGCSEALKAAGYKVAANYHANDDAANAFADETGIAVYRWDVSDEAACAEGIAKVESDLGPIEVLVNNAGISPDRFFHKTDSAWWKSVIDTNLNSLYYMCRPVIQGMRDAKFGRIVNVASLNAIAAAMGETAYDASKAGMIGFTKALALENGRLNVTVNAIAPGYIETDMLAPAPPEFIDDIIAHTPVQRLGTGADIGRAAVFLAADDAGFITGSVVDVNGGYHLH
jgi:acetoacetyl-CoA reductase